MVGVILIGVLFIVTGILAMMYGQKLFSLFLSVYAFSLAFNIIVSQYGQTATTIAIALAVAVVAAILAQYAPKLAFFLLGFVVGIFLSAFLVIYIPDLDSTLALVVILIAALVIGILSAHFNKVFIRLGTAFLGGRSLSIGLLFFIFNATQLNNYVGADLMGSIQNTSTYIAESFTTQYSTYILVATLIFTVIGYYFQSTRKHRRR